MRPAWGWSGRRRLRQSRATVGLDQIGLDAYVDHDGLRLHQLRHVKLSPDLLTIVMWRTNICGCAKIGYRYCRLTILGLARRPSPVPLIN